MDIEGATSLESLMDQMPVQQPPLAPPQTTCTQEVNPGSPAVVAQPEKKKENKKYSKEEIQRLALYVLVAAVIVSLPMVQDKLSAYIPMLQGGGTGALVLNGAIVAAVFYAILTFM